jgi:hypothetical protein
MLQIFHLRLSVQATPLFAIVYGTILLFHEQAMKAFGETGTTYSLSLEVGTLRSRAAALFDNAVKEGPFGESARSHQSIDMNLFHSSKHHIS